MDEAGEGPGCEEEATRSGPQMPLFRFDSPVLPERCDGCAQHGAKIRKKLRVAAAPDNMKVDLQ